MGVLIVCVGFMLGVCIIAIVFKIMGYDV